MCYRSLIHRLTDNKKQSYSVCLKFKCKLKAQSRYHSINHSNHREVRKQSPTTPRGTTAGPGFQPRQAPHQQPLTCSGRRQPASSSPHPPPTTAPQMTSLPTLPTWSPTREWSVQLSKNADRTASQRVFQVKAVQHMLHHVMHDIMVTGTETAYRLVS